MKHCTIIRGTQNAGKTTTCAQLYRSLKEKADSAKLFALNWYPIDDFQYGSDGQLYDFFSIIVIDGKVIVIVSAGDLRDDLEAVLDNLDDVDFFKDISGGFEEIDEIICCGRSVHRRNSAVAMLYERFADNNIKDFWVPAKSDDLEEAFTSKTGFTNEISDFVIDRLNSLN